MTAAPHPHGPAPGLPRTGVTLSLLPPPPCCVLGDPRCTETCRAYTAVGAVGPARTRPRHRSGVSPGRGCSQSVDAGSPARPPPPHMAGPAGFGSAWACLPVQGDLRASLLRAVRELPETWVAPWLRHHLVQAPVLAKRAKPGGHWVGPGVAWVGPSPQEVKYREETQAPLPARAPGLAWVSPGRPWGLAAWPAGLCPPRDRASGWAGLKIAGRWQGRDSRWEARGEGLAGGSGWQPGPRPGSQWRGRTHPVPGGRPATAQLTGYFFPA